MAKNALQSLLGRNRETNQFLRQWADTLDADLWVEDASGALLFGTPTDHPKQHQWITVADDVLGKVSGDSHVDLVASWLSYMAKQEDARKKMGSEVLNLYREMNLMFNFSEKLSAAVDKKTIAAMVLEEAGYLIDFQSGMVIFGADHPDEPEVLAQTGKHSPAVDKVFSDHNLIRQLALADKPEIMQYPGQNEATPLLQWMVAPLRVEHRILGSIVLADENRREFTAAELKLLNTLALQTAAFIENALQYEKAAEKSLELEREKLEKENLQKLDDLKSRFYTNITHEFRTPLTIILGMAAQPQQPGSAGVDERFDMIRRNGAQMLRLVDQLLELSKLDSQAQPLQPVPTEVVTFVNQLAQPFQLVAAENAQTLSVNAGMDALVTIVDPEKLQHVLVNLLSNALKFTPAGGAIQLSLSQNTAGELRITVADNGPGIAPDLAETVFERFFRKPGITQPGSGIGLAYARDLARLMGGDIVLESHTGQGAVFTVYLPINTPSSPTPGKPTLLNETESEDNRPLVLVVEDNPDVARYLQTCLEPAYRTVFAGDGNTGIEMALDTVPDLIVSDIMMPGADGYELCRTLKTDLKTSHIPIVLLTARADNPSKLAGLRQGADAYLSKPFDREELLLHLERLLDMRRALQEHYARLALTEEPVAAKESAPEDAFIQTLRTLVETHLSDEHFGLPELCRQLGMSRSQVFRKMKALLDESPSAFIRNFRLHRAKQLLETTDLQVAEIAFMVGFSEPAYFSFAFHEAFGVTPSSLRR